MVERLPSAAAHVLLEAEQPRADVAQRTRPTVALFIPSLDIGGAERQAQQLALGLGRNGWRVLLITREEPRLALSGDSNVSAIRISGRTGAAVVYRLRRILERENVEILQAFLLGAQVYALAAAALTKRVKLVMAVRSSMGIGEIAGWKGKLGHSLVFGLHALVDRFVFNSTAGESAVGRRIPVERRAVIWNGVDTEHFRPDAAARHRLREIAGLPEGSVVVGIVANVNKDKGYETFVRACSAVAMLRSDVFFVSVGDCANALGRRVIGLVDELGVSGRFRFLGSRADVDRIMPGMDIVCSSSSSEGFSNSIAEAMACGVPAVVTAVGDSPLIVGDSGVVVPPDDAGALAGGLLALLLMPADELREMGGRARKRVEESFGIRQMVGRYEQLYESLLSGVHRPEGGD